MVSWALLEPPGWAAEIPVGARKRPAIDTAAPTASVTRMEASAQAGVITDHHPRASGYPPSAVSGFGLGSFDSRTPETSVLRAADHPQLLEATVRPRMADCRRPQFSSGRQQTATPHGSARPPDIRRAGRIGVWWYYAREVLP